ncbi:hypothetical protein SPI_07926 [Niveomyces insectorum RCEF 264]|uniref:Uncharacterized protein n=1 Tax=Niveomyces insectorum RCEF 264 TaxID=1081102 RepID=A0A162IFA4_9HYPO|nr:hypothetical protein SPI_07926 [Niveomyces insectorum RCEF 264]
MFANVPVTIAAVAGAVLWLGGATRAASSTDFNSVMICTDNIFADGFLYRKENSDGSASTSLGDFPAKVTFPLYLAVTSHADAPLYPIQPAKLVSAHNYQALDQLLYINASKGAFAPVGFVDGSSNATLGAGETTWGFYSGYGFFMFYNPAVAPSPAIPASSSASSFNPVHVQGFQWVPVAGQAGVTQLYWNQTQYDEAAAAAAAGTTPAINAETASFGLCSSDPDADVTTSTS